MVKTNFETRASDWDPIRASIMASGLHRRTNRSYEGGPRSQAARPFQTGGSFDVADSRRLIPPLVAYGKTLVLAIEAGRKVGCLRCKCWPA